MMPTVLVVCEYATLNGGERSLLAVLPPLRAAGIRFIAAAPSDGPLSVALRRQDVDVLPFDVRSRAGVRIDQHDLRLRLREIIRCCSPDLVHANSLSMSRLAGPVTVDCGVPGIAHLRDIINLSRQAIADINRNRIILTVSHATRDWHIQRGLDAEKSCVVYNGVDLQRFCPRPPTGWLHREIGAGRERLLIACIGQIGLRKGGDLFLQAAKCVLNQYRQAHFLLVGERTSEKAEAREFEAGLHAKAAEGALAGRCHFLGWRDDVADILVELALLVHPARQEPLGRVLLEAAATGLPVVATDTGGSREIFPSEESGAILVTANDAKQIQGAICRLLADDDLRCRMSVAARVRAEQNFGAGQAANDILNCYKSVLNPP